MPRFTVLFSALVATSVATAYAASDRGQGDRLPTSVSELVADVPYAAVDVLGVGFSSREIGPKMYAVTANGAAATPLDRLVAIAFARAAEIGLEHKWPTFRVTEFKRTSNCEAWNDDRRSEASIYAGRPKLVMTVVYEPETHVDVRDSAQTFDEMRDRLDQASTNERVKQATVDWVLEYCASTGVKEEATKSAHE